MPVAVHTALHVLSFLGTVTMGCQVGVACSFISIGHCDVTHHSIREVNQCPLHVLSFVSPRVVACSFVSFSDLFDPALFEVLIGVACSFVIIGR